MTASYTSGAVGVPPVGGRRYGGLQMLVVEHESTTSGAFDRSFSALFNPSGLTTDTAVGWRPQETVQPSGQPPRLLPPTGPNSTTLTLELFFDTSLRSAADGPLARAAAGLMSQARGLVGGEDGPSGSNVLTLTSRVFALTQVARELHRPPLCRLWWGENFLMCGALTALRQEFQRFHPDGTPVRARLGCSFTEHPDPSASALELHSPDVARVHRVARGDTLTRLAFTYYGAAGLWREIARANAIENPRELTPGTTLLIPKLS